MRKRFRDPEDVQRFNKNYYAKHSLEERIRQKLGIRIKEARKILANMGSPDLVMRMLTVFTIVRMVKKKIKDAEYKRYSKQVNQDIGRTVSHDRTAVRGQRGSVQGAGSRSNLG